MFNKRLKELRTSHSYSMDKLVALYNAKFNSKMNKSTLSRYENGLQEPMYTVVVNLAELFNVSVDYLIGRTQESATVSTEGKVDFEEYGLKPIEKKKFRILGEIACGEPIYCEEDYETYIEASDDIDADFCLIAKGDSMVNARIYNGDVVFIKEQPIVNNGEIAAVIIDNEATLKRVYYYRDENKLVLAAENPKYSPLVYVNDELNSIRILGRATAFMSYVK